MDNTERMFLETMSKALVSLPFDLKILLEAVADSDLERGVRELAAGTVVHVITPKDGNVDAPLRFAEDVVQLRLALAKIAAEGGEGAPAFRERFAEDYAKFEEELNLFRQALGNDVVDWLDSRWASMLKGVYAKKKISMFVDDEEVGTFLYDEGLRYALPDHREVAGRTGQAGSAVRRPPGAEAGSGQEEDHLVAEG